LLHGSGYIDHEYGICSRLLAGILIRSLTGILFGFLKGGIRNEQFLSVPGSGSRGSKEAEEKCEGQRYRKENRFAHNNTS
jgi:hypothetical protein